MKIPKRLYPYCTRCSAPVSKVAVKYSPDLRQGTVQVQCHGASYTEKFSNPVNIASYPIASRSGALMSGVRAGLYKMYKKFPKELQPSKGVELKSSRPAAPDSELPKARVASWCRKEADWYFK